jgi:hypothetical protein
MSSRLAALRAAYMRDVIQATSGAKLDGMASKAYLVDLTMSIE